DGGTLEATTAVIRGGGSANVSDSEFTHNTGYSLTIAGGRNCVINVLATATDYGVDIGNADAVSVTGSTTTFNTHDGLRVENVRHVHVVSSQFGDNGTDGLWATRNGRTRIGARPGGDASLMNEADGNGGLGINVHDQKTVPHGLNIAAGNGNPQECEPVTLCPA